MEKAGSTPGCSQAVPHPSTNRALCRLTSEVERDPVHSTRYGRQRKWLRNHGPNSQAFQSIHNQRQSLQTCTTITVAILAQGTHRAVASSQAFLLGPVWGGAGAFPNLKPNLGRFCLEVSSELLQPRKPFLHCLQSAAQPASQHACIHTSIDTYKHSTWSP